MSTYIIMYSMYVCVKRKHTKHRRARDNMAFRQNLANVIFQSCAQSVHWLIWSERKGVLEAIFYYYYSVDRCFLVEVFWTQCAWEFTCMPNIHPHAMILKKQNLWQIDVCINIWTWLKSENSKLFSLVGRA